MTSDAPLAVTIVVLAATYLLHSTALLGGVWLGLLVARPRSAALQERLWKLAALLPLVSAPLQIAGGERMERWSARVLPSLAIRLPVDDRLLHGRETGRNELATARYEVAVTGNPDAMPQPLDSRTSPDADQSVATASPPAEASTVEIVPGTSERQSAQIDDNMVRPSDQLVPAPPPSVRNLPEHTSVAALQADHASRQSAARRKSLNRAQHAGEPLVVNRRAGSANVAAAARPHAVQRWLHALPLVLAALCVVGGLRIAWRAAVLRWRLRRYTVLDAGAVRVALDRLLCECDVGRPVRLLSSPTDSEPAAGGVIRWVIVVPKGIEQRISADELRALLAHETAHLVRRDPLWLWIGAALCACLPLQPLNFLAFRRWRQAGEQLCDDWAVAGGVPPLTLARCLTRIAEWRLAPRPAGLTVGLAESHFAQRVGRLVSGNCGEDRWLRPARRRALLAAALPCVVLLACCGPRMKAESGPAPTVSKPLAQPLVAVGGETDGDRFHPADDLLPLPPEPASPPAPQLPAAPAGDEMIDSDLAALISDLRRVEALIGALGDDPEINDIRTRLRARLVALAQRANNRTE